jgi:hypothetical protein
MTPRKPSRKLAPMLKKTLFVAINYVAVLRAGSAIDITVWT